MLQYTMLFVQSITVTWNMVGLKGLRVEQRTVECHQSMGMRALQQQQRWCRRRQMAPHTQQHNSAVCNRCSIKGGSFFTSSWICHCA